MNKKLNKKINEAIQFTIQYFESGSFNTEGTRELRGFINDAANSYADSFDEYQIIFDTLCDLIHM